jgi:hypothetical protein
VGVGCDNPFNQFVASFANAFRSKNVRSIVSGKRWNKH